jgi:hypothetical protein
MIKSEKMIKPARHFFVIAAVVLFTFTGADAQKAVFTTNGGLIIGFGVGTTYQGSDLLNSKGGAFDFHLGHNLGKRDGAFLRPDWKFRFLMGENIAHDHRINPDNTFSNIRYDYFSYDFEIGLTLNRLRERTRIVLSGFAGAGITHGRTFTDLYDENGLLYDYSVIDPSQIRAKVYADLLELSDREYETRLGNRAALMPTAGFYLGYQFSRSFSLGIEHKTIFSLTEHNSFSGINIDNRVMPETRKDRNHYTTLGLRWILGGGGTGRRFTDSIYTRPSQPVTNVTPVQEPRPVVTVPPPVVEIVTPSQSPYASRSESVEITAQVRNVRSRQNIRVQLNGTATEFEYNQATGILRSTLNLREGSNSLIITGSNEAGRATGNATINYVRPIRPPLPEIRFINPPSPVTVQDNTFRISARTLNVGSWNDITLKINGTGTSNFSFTEDGIISMNIGLTEGPNTVEISGRNEAGTATESTTITYTRPAKPVPPVVSFTLPAVCPYKTYESNTEIRAAVSNVTGKENITFILNGRTSDNFRYDQPSGTVIATINLNEGENIITINARNLAGQASGSQAIIKETRPCPVPVLRITDPAGSNVSTVVATYTFRAEAGNITSGNQLEVTLNGKAITDFNFTGTAIVVEASLAAGANILTIAATNECGAQRARATVTYTPPVIDDKPCPAPTVTASISAGDREDATHELRGRVTNARGRSDITITVNGNADQGFTFDQGTGAITSVYRFSPGSYNIVVTVENECGTDTRTLSVAVEQPCVPPVISYRISSVERADATHELRGTVTNVSARNNITLKVNGKDDTSFRFTTSNGEVVAALKLVPGLNNILVTARNECGIDSKPDTVVIREEKPCGPRINPGNAAWQFCLITPSGTFNRDSLSRTSFSYSGPASSLFFMPIAGGGDAMVKGKPYSLRPGQYYLFTGNMTVTISTKNQGSLGQWSVCINADKEPVFGSGNNRPKSPCEPVQDTVKPDTLNANQRRVIKK